MIVAGDSKTVPPDQPDRRQYRSQTAAITPSMAAMAVGRLKAVQQRRRGSANSWSSSERPSSARSRRPSTAFGAAQRRLMPSLFARGSRSVDPLEELLKQLRRAAEKDPAYQRSRVRVLKLGALLVVLVLSAMAVLLSTYTGVVMLNRQFNVMGRYLALFARSGFEDSVRRARASQQLTWVHLIPPQARTEDLKEWYVSPQSSSGDGSLQSSTLILRNITTLLEAYHRCIVYGCESVPLTGETLDGVSTSPIVSEWFFGERAVDQAFRTHASQLRNNPDQLTPTYEAFSFDAARSLPRLYFQLWQEWANLYRVLCIVVMSCLVVAVMAITAFYTRTFLLDAAEEIRDFRFVLSLLPPGTLERIPLGVSFMATTSFAVETPVADSDDFNIMSDEDQQF